MVTIPSSRTPTVHRAEQAVAGPVIVEQVPDDVLALVEVVSLTGGLYALPQHIIRKSLDDPQSKKRAGYRRRFTLLEDMQAKFAAFICTTAA
ncbi:MAG: hypothetical protein GPOALKHO_000719 [Sodalis sp.]|uniref:DUF535 family protein n=1 Tax=Sodalis sp. (in: enterobacteria) TaxID=1898979 RepID=UPI003873683D|nr:MAG: hypothetical protein GPOALKHO_000719 [Sodalis sp.]